jgi:hypothetical protein
VVHPVCVIDVDVQERREQLALGVRRQYDERVTDSDLCRTARLDLARRVEDRPEELGLCRHVTHDEARHDRAVSRPRAVARHAQVCHRTVGGHGLGIV